MTPHYCIPVDNKNMRFESCGSNLVINFSNSLSFSLILEPSPNKTPRILTKLPTDRCWIAETWKIYTFILPILIVVSVNAVIGVRVVIIMFRAAQTNADSKDDLWKIHKVTALILFGGYLEIASVRWNVA